MSHYFTANFFTEIGFKTRAGVSLFKEKHSEVYARVEEHLSKTVNESQFFLKNLLIPYKDEIVIIEQLRFITDKQKREQRKQLEQEEQEKKIREKLEKEKKPSPKKKVIDITDDENQDTYFDSDEDAHFITQAFAYDYKTENEVLKTRVAELEYKVSELEKQVAALTLEKNEYAMAAAKLLLKRIKD
jgi:hypothetical protein